MKTRGNSSHTGTGNDNMYATTPTLLQVNLSAVLVATSVLSRSKNIAVMLPIFPAEFMTAAHRTVDTTAAVHLKFVRRYVV